MQTAIVILSLATFVAVAAQGGEHRIVSSQSIAWIETPSLQPGGRLAIIHGDPSKEGAFTIRLKFPDGVRVGPHWHPTDEHLTILAGTFLIAHGEKFDAAALKPIATGDYAFMPKEMRHFGQTQGETIIQLSGMGPFRTYYVNPEDDPRTRKTSTKD